MPDVSDIYDVLERSVQNQLMNDIGGLVTNLTTPGTREKCSFLIGRMGPPRNVKRTFVVVKIADFGDARFIIGDVSLSDDITIDSVQALQAIRLSIAVDGRNSWMV